MIYRRYHHEHPTSSHHQQSLSLLVFYLVTYESRGLPKLLATFHCRFKGDTHTAGIVETGPATRETVSDTVPLEEDGYDDAPGTADSVGKGVAAHAASMSSIVLPAGRNGSRTVPVAMGITSEQSVSELWVKPSSESLSITPSKSASILARFAKGSRIRLTSLHRRVRGKKGMRTDQPLPLACRPWVAVRRKDG